MADYYELTSFKSSDFKDDHGNTWCDATFRGVGEPVKWVVKDPTRAEVGNKYYGRIEEKTSKAGKPYNRFYTETKPDGPVQSQDKPSEEYWADKQAQIRAQWAIGQSVQWALSFPENARSGFSDIEEWAKVIYAMVDRVKNGEVVTDTKTDEDKVVDFDPAEADIINLNDIPF